MSMPKIYLRDTRLDKWFKDRELKAINDYLEYVKELPEKYFLLVHNGEQLNPLEIPQHKIKGVMPLKQGTSLYNALYRYLTTMKDKRVTGNYLTLILNNIETTSEFLFILDEKIIEDPKLELVNFKKQISNKLKFIKRMKLLGEIS